MSGGALRFWGSAAGAAIAFAALAPVLFPFRALGLDPAADRERVWLLLVFTTGAMLLLFGLSALLSGRRAVGVRDVFEAGGVRQAQERARGGGEGEDAPGYTRNAALWTMATGALLVVAYLALWTALG